MFQDFPLITGQCLDSHLGDMRPCIILQNDDSIPGRQFLMHSIKYFVNLWPLVETSGSLNSSNKSPCMSKNNSRKMPNDQAFCDEYPSAYTLLVLTTSLQLADLF
ncbi:hypothetical protein TNIN_430851 [Trichonephila inaurata madagascariensis]|uniref:Uncharacterized protein n=1 Tax=Trichonephila inaurata madagascariensis TaxID=2747483 RepID=A0A8X6WWR8_9ARAC|nr:hypothetical protein TNIN_430851 [Trichonephila inaurata madagascariensis]